MTGQKNIAFTKAIKRVSASARRKAFRQNQPVAISIEGKTYLLFPDGTRRPLTRRILQELRHAKA